MTNTGDFPSKPLPTPPTADLYAWSIYWDNATMSAEAVRNIMYTALNYTMTLDQRRQIHRHVAIVRSVANDPKLAMLFGAMDEQDDTVKPPMPDIEITAFVRELGQMYADDPNRMTETESAFIGTATRPRTREIGQQIHDAGGKKAMLRVHDAILAEHGAGAADMLRISWGGIGGWLD